MVRVPVQQRKLSLSLHSGPVCRFSQWPTPVWLGVSENGNACHAVSGLPLDRHYDLARRGEAAQKAYEELGNLQFSDVGELVPGGGIPRAFPVVRVLDGEPPDPPSMLVDELLLDCDINLWGGLGGASKSVLALATAVSVALGCDVFGAFKVRRCGPVLIVAPEDGQGVVRMIVDALVAGLDLTAEERAGLQERLFIVPDSESVDLCVDTGRLRDTALACGAVLVVLDPLVNLLGTGEDNPNEIAKTVTHALRRDVCRGAGSTVLMNHHLNKPGKERGADSEMTVHDVRGAGGWVNGARLVFGVVKREGENITMKALKANRLRADLRHELRLEIEADSDNQAHWRSCRVIDRNRGASSDAFTPGIGRELNLNERHALTTLDDQHEAGLRMAWSAWRDGSGLNANTFRSVKKRLLDAGLVLAVPTGRKNRNGGADYSYQISEEGRKALTSGWVNEPLSGEGVRSGE